MMRGRTLVLLPVWVCLLLLAGACGRRKPAAVEASSETAPSRTEQVRRSLPPPPPPSSRPFVLPLGGDGDDLPAASGAVWWSIAPTGATLRISGPGAVGISTSATERLSISLRTGFYLVEISHPGYETWTRRMALGGAATNHIVSLELLPPPVEEEAVVALEVTLAPDSPEEVRPARRDLTLETLMASSETQSVPTPGADGSSEPAPSESHASEPAPSAPELPSETVAEIAEAAPEESVAAAATAGSQPPALRPTERVRIRVVSSAAGDGFLPQAVKHLHIGRRDLRPFRDLTMELPFADVGDTPLTMRAQHYEVKPGALQATAYSPEGLCELVFQATPHPVSLTFSRTVEGADVWQEEAGSAVRRIASATRALWLEPFREHHLQVRARGYQPLRVVLPTPEPASTFSEVALDLMPLPLSGRPGQTCLVDIGGGVDLALAWVPGGRVVLTDPRFEGAPPDVRVEFLPRGFWMARGEISRAQWHAIMGGPAGVVAPTEAGLPKTGVAWEEAVLFTRRLTQVLANGTARLPTEAEWEHAAFAGKSDPLGGISAGFVRHAANSAGAPAAAMFGPPSDWSLHTMRGNVREWCADLHGPYRTGQTSGPVRRVVRGGGFRSPLEDCRADVRDAEVPGAQLPDLGFRVVVVPGLP